ncbi:MAG: phage tail family protein [Clostridia bacterium]|nr:phage tail family protein [Clostridia bacterium]
MFNIRFYNETGSIDFGGGNSGSKWKVLAAEGLAFCGRSFAVAKYAGQDGQKTTSVTVNARTITLSGDVFLGDDFDLEFKSAMTVLENEGTIEIQTGLGTRLIRARCCDFRENERKGKYMLFVVQFICDDPYFEDADKTEVAIYKRVSLFDKYFTFPGKFSERISRRNIEYAGTRETEPTLFISIDEGKDGDNQLVIKNHTSGESLTFNYGGVLGDFITVDIKNRKIYNQDGENLLKYLADDSFFDGFHLFPGSNDIEVINRNTNTGITVTCCFSNRYSEAVYI